MTRIDKVQEGPLRVVFNKHCAGRFEFELPEDMQLFMYGYDQPQFYIDNLDWGHTAELTDEHRVEQWLTSVEEWRLRMAKHYPTMYVIKDLALNLKTIVFYIDCREHEQGEKRYCICFFKDFPEQQLGLSINGIITGDTSNIEEVLQQRLQWMHQAIDKIEYQPWPHKQVGICLQNNLFIANLQPLKNELGNYCESYWVEFTHNKSEDSMFRICVNIVNTKKVLKTALRQYTGIVAFFTGRTTMVAGREGRLFVRRVKRSNTQREFTWVSTDTKINSVRYAHIEISGTIEIKDFPAMAPLNATEMIIGLLKGVQVRPNGMVGVSE